MSREAIIILVLFYTVPLVFMLVYNIINNWKFLHTVRDFLFPLDEEDNILIWCPVLNALYTIAFMLSFVIDGIERFMDLKIKK